MKCDKCGQELPETTEIVTVEPEKPGTQAWYLARALPRLKRLDQIADAAYPSVGTHYDWRARQEWDRLMREQMADEVAAGL